MKVLLFALVTMSGASVLFSSEEKKEVMPFEPTKIKCTSETDPITKGAWQLEETYILEGNSIDKYQRGGIDNTINYDSEAVNFNCDGTGFYVDIFGKTIAFKWSYLDEGKTKIRLILHYPGHIANLTYTMVEVKNDVFTGTLYYTSQAGYEVLASFKRKLVPEETAF